MHLATALRLEGSPLTNLGFEALGFGGCLRESPLGCKLPRPATGFRALWAWKLKVWGFGFRV